MDERVGRIVSAERLIELREEWRRGSKRVVFAVGAFDLLHPGHIRLLEQARSLGDILVVAVTDNADDSAGESGSRNSQGAPGRSIVPPSERVEILAALAAVDFVTALQGVPASDWIHRFRPDVHVKGGAAGPETRQKSMSQAADGTRVVNIPFEPGYSTALLIERIQQLRQ